MRKPISKKVRFEVFKKDGFCCVYCGLKPPTVILEVDHIVPVSKGGKNNMENLVTSCFDCNRGKSNKSLDTVTDSISERMEQTKERAEQYKCFIKYTRDLDNINNQMIEMVQDAYQLYHPDYHFSERFRQSVLMFIQKLGIDVVIDAMRKSCTRLNHEQSTSYFCGICWNKIRENDF